jgi:hypothetical protein
VRAQSTTTDGGRFAAKAASAKRVLQQLEDRKNDNVRSVSTVFGDIGRKDVQYFKSLHEDLVHLSKSALEEHREWAEAVRHDRAWPSSSKRSSPLDPEVMSPSDDAHDDLFDN